MEATFSMFSRPESRTMQRGLAFPAEPKPRQSLTEKYRPKYLTDIVGQGSAVMRLMDFADAPYPSAWILAGPTGTGKTSAALALATEMGIDRGWGLHQIKSADAQDEQLSKSLDLLRYCCPAGSGWKLLLIDEADMMSTKAKARCLSAIEDIPDQSVIVFTTNNPEKFDRRFRDRCETIEFTGDPGHLAPDCDALLRDIWAREGLPGDPLPLASIPDFIADGAVSFRRIVRTVEMYAKGWRPSPLPAPAVKPVRKAATA